MSIRDRLSKKPNPARKQSSPPKWVKEGTKMTKNLYQSTVEEYRRIEHLIKSNKSQGPKDRRLVLATIARMARCDRSLVTPRRQPELCDFISRLNNDLRALSDLHPTNYQRARGPTKRELAREVGALRRATKRHAESDKRAIVEEFFASNLLDDRDKLARETARLRNENQALTEKISRLEQLAQQISRENAALHDLLTNSQRSELQGLQMVRENGKNPNTRNDKN